MVPVGRQALPEADRARLETTLEQQQGAQDDLRDAAGAAGLWERSNDSREQLLARLQDWCHRAEASGIAALQNFSRTLAQLRVSEIRSQRCKKPAGRRAFFRRGNQPRRARLLGPAVT